MKLLKLTLRNFKGTKEFVFEPNGSSATVFGANAAGKTTLHDAFSWLLHGKDSANRADFDIKTLDEHNQPIHKLDHEVEAVLKLADGRTVTLRKVYAEKYTRRRGSATAEFTGHTTDHYIDGVPVTKSEYDRTIGELADESVFRLLSDPTYFNDHMHWQQRRELLLQVVGDVTDEEVIASDDKLAELTEILTNRTLDQHRKVVMERRTGINRELDRIPVRIDEVHRGLPELPSSERADVEARLAELRGRRAELSAERTRITSGGQVAEYRRQLAEIETQMADAERRARASVDEKIRAKAKRRTELTERKAALESELAAHRSAISTAEKAIAHNGELMSGYRGDWERINAEEFSETLAAVADACPACEQPLPAERVAEARSKAEADLERRRAEFNERKAAQLAAVTGRGKQLKAENDALSEAIAAARQKAETVKSELAQVTADLDGINGRIAELQTQVPDVTADPEYQQLADSKANIEATIATLLEDQSAALAVVDTDIRNIDDQIQSVEGAVARFEAHDRGTARIAELEAEERKLAAEFERLEHELFLIDEFTKTKVRMLDERINSRFRIARFKMFVEQVNGGIEPTCQTMLNGVPWPSINGAGKIQVGLDIIQTLAEHYGFAPPVFIDDAVTITDIPETRGQQIRLVVSAEDETLRVELDTEKQLKEAS